MEWQSTIGDWTYDSKNKIVYGPHYTCIFINLGFYGYWHIIGPY
jgi:hypothetical protein